MVTGVLSSCQLYVWYQSKIAQVVDVRGVKELPGSIIKQQSEANPMVV